MKNKLRTLDFNTNSSRVSKEIYSTVYLVWASGNEIVVDGGTTQGVGAKREAL